MNIENVERRAKGEERTVEAKMGGERGRGQLAIGSPRSSDAGTGGRVGAAAPWRLQIHSTLTSTASSPSSSSIPR